ncbi:MAG: hydroxymethylglutaryl-CoA synthase [bacterium]
MNNYKFKQTGIISYGAYIPKYRITINEIATNWHKDPTVIMKGLGIIEKAVPATTDDTISLAVNASKIAISKLAEKPLIGAVYTGSESHPYAVKSTSAIVGEALGIGNNFTAADLEFACKAGTAGMQIVAGMVESGMIDNGLAIGADTAQSKPGDALEYSASAASAAYLMGSNKTEMIAELILTVSFTSDTPDFWRRENQKYPSHAGRFTGEPSYFKHIISAAKEIMSRAAMNITDFSHVILHMPNAKFPQIVAQQLKISEKQLEAGFIVPYLGNSYSACSMVGLSGALDVAKPGEYILLCSYGSGSGSDAFIFKVTDNINQLKILQPLSEQIKHKQYLTYSQYLFNLNQLFK